MGAKRESFSLHVPEADIADLRDRLARTRFPDQGPGERWAYGTDLTWMKGLVEYWRDAFDWRAQEARLNAFPQYKVGLHGIDLHFLHVPGKGPNPFPLLLSHGWPGSVFEFLDLIPQLTDPGRFGADPADAFTIVEQEHVPGGGSIASRRREATTSIDGAASNTMKAAGSDHTLSVGSDKTAWGTGRYRWQGSTTLHRRHPRRQSFCRRAAERLGEFA